MTASTEPGPADGRTLARFALVSLLLYGCFALAASATSLDRLLWDRAGFSVLQVMGLGPTLGDTKMLLLALLGAACVAATLVFYLRQVRQPGRLPRTAILGGTLALYLCQSVALAYPPSRGNEMDNLRIVELPTVEYDQILSKAPLLEAKIESYHDFSQACRKRFKYYEPELRKRWGVEDSKELEAIFYLNLVSHLWGYGNVTPALRDRPGGVLLNERTGFQEVKDPTIRTYLESDIGCCTDYALLLKKLLDEAGIPNHRVGVAGHIFNEARVAGRWITLDANTAMVFDRDWASVQGRKADEQVTVIVFPHQNCIEKDNPYYRPEVGQFRVRWLLAASQRTAPPISYPDGRS